MQKHIDWKRVGWTLGIPLFITIPLAVAFWLLWSPIYLVECLLYGAFNKLWSITKNIVDYYHHGESKKSQDYQLPLSQCKTCKVKQHCLVIKVKRCPNELGEVKSKGHVK